MNLNNITTALKTGITIYQYEQWQNTGSVNLMQKESHMLSKVWLKTNIHNPDSLDKPFIQLSATFTSESDIQEYNEWLDANQYKLYPLLLDILKISLRMISTTIPILLILITKEGNSQVCLPFNCLT